MRRFHRLAFALLAVTCLGAAPARAQATYQSPDTRILHNDLYALGQAIAAAIKAQPASPDPTPAIAGLGTKMDLLHSDLQAVLTQLKAAPPASASGGTGATPAAPAAPAAGYDTTTVAGVNIPNELTDPCKGVSGKWTTLTLTPADSIQRAMLCAAPAFKLTLQAGTYQQSFLVPAELAGWDIGGVSAGSVKIDGRGGCTVNDNNAGGCDTRLAWRKGVVLLLSAGTLHDLELTGGGSKAQGGHDGQAGAYIETSVNGLVTFRKLMVRGNQMGLFSNAGATNASALVELCDFVSNSTDGGSHDTYFGGLREVTFRDSNSYGSLHGNNFKTRAVPLVHAYGGYNISREGRWIECAEGCQLDIHGGTYVGNTCCQNLLGNGTEATSTQPISTTIDGSTMWLGRWSDFATAGSFSAANVNLTLGGNGSGAFNSKGGPLVGLNPGASNTPPPPAQAYVSGGK